MVIHGPTFAPFPVSEQPRPGPTWRPLLTQRTSSVPVRRRHACDLLVRQRTHAHVPSRNKNIRNPYTQPGTHRNHIPAFFTFWLDAIDCLSHLMQYFCVTLTFTYCFPRPTALPTSLVSATLLINAARTRCVIPPPLLLAIPSYDHLRAQHLCAPPLVALRTVYTHTHAHVHNQDKCHLIP